MKAPLLTAFLLLVNALVAQHVTLRIRESAEPINISFKKNEPTGGGFRSIVIRSNGRETTLRARNVMACAPASKDERKRDISWSYIEGMRLDGSLCFYVGEFGVDTAKHTILAFVSEGWASDAAPVIVIGFNTSGLPYKVIERDELDLTSLVSKPDGSALLIGKPTLSQVIAPLDYDSHKDPYATTYDPFAVYVVSPNRLATYSLSESRRYNVEHYVWAGPKSSESYAVLYNIPGHSKPFGVAADKASAILSRAAQEAKK